MFRVKKNQEVGHNIYVMELEDVKGNDVQGEPGQFFMIRVEGSEMVLSRPLSIMDIQGPVLMFMYRVVGKGTQIMSKLIPGEDITAYGPYGKGFPVEQYKDSKVALVGGGMGIAPLFFTARRLNNATLYLGMKREDLTSDQEETMRGLIETYGEYHLHMGHNFLDDVSFENYEAVMTCGPEGMMECIVAKHDNTYVSMEKHMGCGVGACMSCTCQVEDKRVKVCKDGPVFLGRQVNFHA